MFNASNSSDGIIREAVRQMLRASEDERGTVRGLARELDEAREDGNCILTL